MIQIQHCYQEANKYADTLARRGALLPQDFVIFLEPPAEVLFLLSLDVSCLVFIKASFLPKKRKKNNTMQYVNNME